MMVRPLAVDACTGVTLGEERFDTATVPETETAPFTVNPLEDAAITGRVPLSVVEKDPLTVRPFKVAA